MGSASSGVKKQRAPNDALVFDSILTAASPESVKESRESSERWPGNAAAVTHDLCSIIRRERMRLRSCITSHDSYAIVDYMFSRNAISLGDMKSIKEEKIAVLAACLILDHVERKGNHTAAIFIEALREGDVSLNSLADELESKTRHKSDSDLVDPNKTDKCTLFVNNLSFSTTHDSIQKVFTDAVKITTILNRYREQTRFAFVQFQSEEKVKEAMTKHQGVQIDGRTLTLDYRRPKGTSKTTKLVDKKDKCTLFVKNLSIDTTKETIQKVFTDAVNVRIPLNGDRKPRGIAFLQFPSEEKVEEAMKQHQGVQIDGRAITLDYYRSKSIFTKTDSVAADRGFEGDNPTDPSGGQSKAKMRNKRKKLRERQKEQQEQPERERTTVEQLQPVPKSKTEQLGSASLGGDDDTKCSELEKRLRKATPQLVQGLDRHSVYCVADALLAARDGEGLITNDQYQELEAERTDSGMVRKLLRIVCTRGDDAIQTLALSLKCENVRRPDLAILILEQSVL